MCVIAVYEKGLALNELELKTCFNGNPNGAGLMYQKDGLVHIEKGFMTWEKFWEAAKKLPSNVDRVFHFRIATSGKISAACCHPFPITDDYKKMSLASCDTPMGFAHNGVLGDFEPKKGMKSTYSDSMKFGKEVLFHLGNLLNERSVRDLIELYTTSRFAIMTPKNTYMIGSWEQSRESGAFYSNSSYVGTRYFDCMSDLGGMSSKDFNKYFCSDYWDNGYTCDDYTEAIFIERIPVNEKVEDEVIAAIEEQLGVFVYDTSDSNKGKAFKDTTFFFERDLGKKIPESGTLKVCNREVKWRFLDLDC